jgi:hypothetical protein
MAAPLTPKPTRKAEALAKAPPTIASRLPGCPGRKEKENKEKQNVTARR